MSSEENKAVVRRYLDLMNAGAVERLKEVIAVSYVDHSAAPESQAGLEGEKQFLAMVRNAFPDAHWTIEDILAEDDRVAVRVTFRGTQRGEFLGMAPTQRQVAMLATAFIRLSNGRIVESWINRDRLSLMQQLGALTG